MKLKVLLQLRPLLELRLVAESVALLIGVFFSRCKIRLSIYISPGTYIKCGESLLDFISYYINITLKLLFLL